MGDAHGKKYVQKCFVFSASHCTLHIYKMPGATGLNVDEKLSQNSSFSM
jgi:hypothetical protein